MAQTANAPQAKQSGDPDRYSDGSRPLMEKTVTHDHDMRSHQQREIRKNQNEGVLRSGIFAPSQYPQAFGNQDRNTVQRPSPFTAPCASATTPTKGSHGTLS